MRANVFGDITTPSSGQKQKINLNKHLQNKNRYKYCENAENITVSEKIVGKGQTVPLSKPAPTEDARDLELLQITSICPYNAVENCLKSSFPVPDLRFF